MPLGIKDMTVEEGWEKTDFLNKVDGTLRLKRSHKYYFKAQGEMGNRGYPKNYFVVWTTKSKPHIEVIIFDSVFWQDMLSKLIVFFRTYIICRESYLIAGLFAIVCAVESLALNQRNFTMKKKTASSVAHVYCGVIGVVLVLQ